MPRDARRWSAATATHPAHHARGGRPAPGRGSSAVHRGQHRVERGLHARHQPSTHHRRSPPPRQQHAARPPRRGRRRRPRAAGGRARAWSGRRRRRTAGCRPTETKAPRPGHQGEHRSLCRRVASPRACSASSTWIGPKKPASQPRLASASETHPPRGGCGRLGEALGEPPRACRGVTGPVSSAVQTPFEQEHRDLAVGLLLVLAVRRPGGDRALPPLRALLALGDPRDVGVLARGRPGARPRGARGSCGTTSGARGAPPLDAIATYTPSRSTRITGFLRSLPDFAPTRGDHHDRVTPCAAQGVGLAAPSVASYSSTWSRTHCAGLGSYSPSVSCPPQHHAPAAGFRPALALRAMSAIEGVSEIFDPDAWDDVPGFEDLTDLTYHRAKAHGTVRIAFDRPDVLNAFRPHTVDELLRVLEHARTSQRRRLRAAHRQRPERQERQVGVLHRRRPADPRQGRLPVRADGHVDAGAPPNPSTRPSSAGCTSWSASG